MTGERHQSRSWQRQQHGSGPQFAHRDGGNRALGRRRLSLWVAAITLTNAGVTSIAGTANQITASGSTGDVTLSLPATINVDTTGNAATATLAYSGLTGTVPIWNQDTTGNAQTATFANNATTATLAIPAGSFTGSLSGDVTGTQTVTVVGKINGGSVPASAHVIGTNASSQPVAATATDLAAPVYAAGGGTGDAQTVTLSPAVAALSTGLVVRWKPTAANTAAAPTLAVNGLTATTITKCGATALVASDLTTAAYAEALYDGTEFQLLNPQAGGCGGVGNFTGALAGDVTGTQGATSVVKVNGGSVPASAPLLGSNSSSQLTSVTTLPTSAMPALTGDVTTPGSSLATTLATVNANTGSFGDATHVGSFTVNGKGLITAASAVAISGVAPGGTASGDLSGSYPGPTVAQVNGAAVPTSASVLARTAASNLSLQPLPALAT